MLLAAHSASSSEKPTRERVIQIIIQEKAREDFCHVKLELFEEDKSQCLRENAEELLEILFKCQEMLFSIAEDEDENNDDKTRH